MSRNAAFVGRGSSRSFSDSGSSNHQRPVRFHRPIDDDAAAANNQSNGPFSRTSNHSLAGSPASVAADSPPTSTTINAANDVAKNMRSVEICCSAALADSPAAASANGQQSTTSSAQGQEHFLTRAPICLRHRLSRLFASERMADIYFVLNAQQQPMAMAMDDLNPGPSLIRVPAHKLLLSVASPVFDAMFNNGQITVEGDSINIPDVEYSAFMALLRFIYTDQVDVTPESVMAVLYAAKKYAVDSLQERCVDFLRSKLNRETAFLLLSQARLFDEPQLASLCLDVIDRHTNEAMSTESFLDIDMDTLKAVLQRDTLCIRENRIFSHVHRWAEHECSRQGWPLTSANKRKALGSALSLVRFPLMTPEEFANDAAQTGLLDNHELVSLFLWFLATPKPSCAQLFPIAPRCCTVGRELTASRFQHVELRWGYSGTPDKIKFTVSRPIYVVGLGLYGSVTSGSHYNTVIQLMHYESREIKSQNEVEYETDGSKKTYLVRFREPVAIEADTVYLASATICGADTYYGTRGQRRVVVELVQDKASDSPAQSQPDASMVDDGPHQNQNVTMASASTSVTFSFFHNGNNNGTSVDDGQIPEIVFYP